MMAPRVDSFLAPGARFIIVGRGLAAGADGSPTRQ
jgi:hypothetical protein